MLRVGCNFAKSKIVYLVKDSALLQCYCDSQAIMLQRNSCIICIKSIPGICDIDMAESIMKGYMTLPGPQESSRSSEMTGHTSWNNLAKICLTACSPDEKLETTSCSSLDMPSEFH